MSGWGDILFANNNTTNRLNDCPLTDCEMEQMIEQITILRTPLKLNGFINLEEEVLVNLNFDEVRGIRYNTEKYEGDVLSSVV